MDEEIDSTPLSETTRNMVIEWNRFNRESEIAQSTFLLVICVLIALPLLFFSGRYIVEDLALTCFGNVVQARVVQTNEPISYTFSVNNHTYHGATLGRTRGFRSGDPVDVLYFPAYPQCSKVNGMSISTGFLRLWLTVGVLAAFGAFSLWKKRRLLLLEKAASVDPPVMPDSPAELASTDAMPLTDNR